VEKSKKIRLDFIIDKLTNSIQNTISGDSFPTEISRFTLVDSKLVKELNAWKFNWDNELEDNSNEVYKLTIHNNPNIIQGLLSVKKENDHIFLNLLESAPFNIGKNKLYDGVAGNLVAYACKLSFQYGFDGFVTFFSKTNLIKHYETTLGAVHFGGQKMILETHYSKELVDKYFKY
jgi:hypothetical protein